MASLNTDILIRSMLLEGIFVSFVLSSARGSATSTLAANQILLQFLA
jgi:MATE family multidrug resistance protein